MRVRRGGGLHLDVATASQAGIDESMRASADGLRHENQGDSDHGARQPADDANTTAATATTRSSDGATTPPKSSGFERPEGCPPSGIFQPAAAAQRVSADGTVTPCIEGGPTIPVDADDTRLASDGGDTRIETVEHRTVTTTGCSRWPSTVAARIRSRRSLDEVERRARFAADASGDHRPGRVSVRRCSSGWLVARRVVQPVEQLRDTAERIAVTQDLATPIPDGGAAEIGSLAAELHDDGRRTG